jgi:hypothetical protein
MQLHGYILGEGIPRPETSQDRVLRPLCIAHSSVAGWCTSKLRMHRCLAWGSDGALDQRRWWHCQQAAAQHWLVHDMVDRNSWPKLLS